jgi:peroxiredoxin
MVIDKGVIKSLEVENPGEFKVSSAEHILSLL